MKAEKNRCVSPLIISIIIMGILVLGSAMIVVADEAPYADADPDHQTVNVGEEAYFSGSGSIDRDGYIVSYDWVFGDGFVYHGENISYIFNAPGDFTVTLTVVDDFGNSDSDSVTVTVQDGTPSENLTVWIESLTTDKAGYEENETVTTQVIVERGNDLLTYVWEGTLVLEVFDDAKALVYTDEATVNLPTGGASETHNFEFILTESGDFLVIAILYDSEDKQVDIMEISITVREGSGGGNDPPGGGGNDPPDDDNGTRDDDRNDPPDDGNGTPNNEMVWIESLTTDKEEYIVDDTIKTTVVVKRGDDWLTYVWEGTLILEVYDHARVLVFTDSRHVYIPSGGMSQIHNFEFMLSEAGEYFVIAQLYDFEDNKIDQEEICINVVKDPSGGNGTVPPNETDPPDNNNMGFFTGDKGGIFQGESGMQIALATIVSIALLFISSFAVIRYHKSPGNKKEKS
jgi:hypothetical protein